MNHSPPPQLINIFRVAIVLKLIGAVVGVISGNMLIQEYFLDRWLSALLSSIVLLLLLMPWLRYFHGKQANITHLQLIMTLALAILAPQIELIHSSHIQWLPSNTLFIAKLGWSQEQINNIHALGGLFTMVPVVLASWQYGARGMFLSLAWAGLLYVITPLVLPPDAFTWRLYVIRGFVLLGVTLILAITTYTLVKAQRREQAALEAANQQLAIANQQLAQQAAVMEQLAINRERNRLARELHDTLAHSLSGTAVQLQAIEVLLRVDSQAAAVEVKAAQQQIRHGLQEARRSITALRASPLEELGLVEALRHYALRISERAGIPIDCTIEQPSYTLPPLSEQTIYRVAEEALLNAEKHAQASQLKLSLRQSEQLVLTVWDNGVGFDSQIKQQDGHFGLLGMRERAKLIGAALTIESHIGEGSTITLSVPSYHL